MKRAGVEEAMWLGRHPATRMRQEQTPDEPAAQRSCAHTRAPLPPHSRILVALWNRSLAHQSSLYNSVATPGSGRRRRKLALHTRIPAHAPARQSDQQHPT